MDKKISIVFADEKLKKTFERLKKSKTEDKRLCQFISRAVDDLKKDPACGTHIPNNLIPREYVIKYQINNLWKYDLPDGWRLIYSIKGSEIALLCILIEWLSHKNYEKRFGYRTR
jgi:Txe/YoeB family toxin of Txe-Axe toxin-antitoxin module